MARQADIIIGMDLDEWIADLRAQQELLTEAIRRLEKLSATRAKKGNVVVPETPSPEHRSTKGDEVE